ncbi:serine/threonine-protein kinase [Streptomyces fragilis]|uniref:serine/threonine-protein kinase n=1 Tax=Streptomyces fragilis TaxID=67301 RepID=UPI0024DE2A04|nr:serine/threonine-protein kinase [Streptomyces fragilis]
MEMLGAGDPERIGAYRLLARLGVGGMGQVFLARSDRGRTVAVKLVRAELAAREEFRARFRHEVRAARRVGGDWTAPVLDADTEAAVPWVATGYVAGPSLERVVGRDHGALPERTVRILAAGLARALGDIHAAGLVHRDLKPSNVLITIDGPRVIDFGIARALETSDDSGLTRAGAVVGSPGFMAPEQVRGERITAAVDVFSLGSVLAYAVTGRLPFGDAESGPHALMYRIAQDEPDLTGVPEGLTGLIGECLRKDPAARPSLEDVLSRVGGEQATLGAGRTRDPWLPAALVAQLGRHAAELLDVEDPGPRPEEAPTVVTDPGTPPPPAAPAAHSAPPVTVPPAAAPAFPPGFGAPHPFTADHGQGPAQGHGPGPGPGHGGAGHGGAGHGGAGHGHGHGDAGHGGGGYGGTGHGSTGHGDGGYGGGGYGRPHVPGHTAGHFGQPAWGATAVTPAGPPDDGGRTRTAVLVAAATLVVALIAGGVVHGVMRGKDTHDRADKDTRTSSSDTAGTETGGKSGPPPTTSADDGNDDDDDTGDAGAGAVPERFLGEWSAVIENAAGSNPRHVTLTRGEVGDPVLTLVAEGPLEGTSSSYRCVFEAVLTDAPDGDGVLGLGPSRVVDGEPLSSCSAGAPSTLTVEGGSLTRTMADGESLTYTRD